MTNKDKARAAIEEFIAQAIAGAIERMKPELVAASEASHKGKDVDPDYDDGEDRVAALGYLILCGSDLFVLAHIAVVLDRLHSAEDAPHHH